MDPAAPVINFELPHQLPVTQKVPRHGSGWFPRSILKTKPLGIWCKVGTFLSLEATATAPSLFYLVVEVSQVFS